MQHLAGLKVKGGKGLRTHRCRSRKGFLLITSGLGRPGLLNFNLQLLQGRSVSKLLLS